MEETKKESGKIFLFILQIFTIHYILIISKNVIIN